MSRYDNLSQEELEALRDRLEAELADVRNGDDEPVNIPNVSDLGGAGGRSWDGDLPEQPERKREGFSGFAPNHEVVKLAPTAAEDDEGRPLSFSERFQRMWQNQ